jgi:hypothetical protein
LWAFFWFIDNHGWLFFRLRAGKDLRHNTCIDVVGHRLRKVTLAVYYNLPWKRGALERVDREFQSNSGSILEMMTVWTPNHTALSFYDLSEYQKGKTQD